MVFDKYMYKVHLNQVELPVYLGVYDFEQQQKQLVLVDIEIRFLEMPKGCISDQLEDVICYAGLNDTLLKAAEEKRYQLIEHLAYVLCDRLMLGLKFPADISLTVHKNPPLDNIHQASFTMERQWQM